MKALRLKRNGMEMKYGKGIVKITGVLVVVFFLYMMPMFVVAVLKEVDDSFVVCFAGAYPIPIYLALHTGESGFGYGRLETETQVIRGKYYQTQYIQAMNATCISGYIP